jgi:hypothetical protein
MSSLPRDRCHHRAQLALRFRCPGIGAFIGSPGPRQLPFGPGTMPVSGQLGETTAGGSGLAASRSCCLSATGIGFLDHRAPAGELGLPYGRLTESASGPRRGCHVPHGRAATGVGALCTPRPAVSRRLAPSHQPPPAASQRPALPPAPHPISGGFDDEASTRVRLRSPVRSSPCLWPPDGAGALGRLP